MSWKATVQGTYNSFNALVAFDATYSIASRLGFRDARHLWDANPTITGSVEPRDLRVIIPRDEKIEGKRVRCYDNGGKTCDRYSALYLDEPAGPANSVFCRGMSEHPSHPQGFGQTSWARAGSHLGKRILFAQLPEECQQVVRRDLS